MLREYIISEAMFALGIPTTRSLAVVTTGEPVYRETVLDGAVLTRVAASHVRVGTMELGGRTPPSRRAAALADYTSRRHYPELADVPDPHVALFDAIVDRQARLVARWQHVGFIHGVMNTDNMALSGETIDYGPCAFMDAYDPATVFSSIDHGRRYAYGNQPASPNGTSGASPRPCSRSSIRTPSGPSSAPRRRSRDLPPRSTGTGWPGARAKLGLFTEEVDDRQLVLDLLAWMQRRSADFTNTFRALSSATPVDPGALADPEVGAWHQRWQTRRERQPQSRDESDALMRRHNPTVIPRNHKVEAALEAATIGHDLAPMRALLEVLAAPYDDAGDLREFSEPGPDGQGYRTFCGT